MLTHREFSKMNSGRISEEKNLPCIQRECQHHVSSPIFHALFVVCHLPHSTLCVHAQLRHECVEAGKWPVGKWDGKTTYSLENFVAAQDVQRGKSEGLLEALNQRVRAIVLGACASDLHHFLVKNGFRQNQPASSTSSAATAAAAAATATAGVLNQSTTGEEDGSGSGSGAVAHTGSGDDASPSSSPTPSSSQNNNTSHAERAAHRTECRRLTKFVRLCDFLVLDALVSMSLERATEMLKIVRTKVRGSADESINSHQQ
jgi:hypothetical protein